MASNPTKLSYNPAIMTVVIIDDQDPIRKAIKRVLTSMGFGTVLEFFDGYEAIKEINKKNLQIDLVITDLYMRRADGFQVLKKIRSKDFASDIPVLVVTGEGGKEDIVQAIDAGADEYILKPFQISDIEKKVTSLLQKYHSPPPLLKLIREGERLLVSQDFQDALKIFEAALRLDPSSTKAQYLKAMAMDAMGHPGEALHILKEASANNTTFYKNYTAMANIYLKLDEKIHAIDSLKNELELNPKQAARQILVAQMLLEQGDSLGAIDHFREALKENGKLKDALIGMGKAYEASQNHEKAIYYFKRARRNHPNLTLALELIVRNFDIRGELKKVFPVLQDEINSAPNKADARIIAAHLYQKFEELDKALKVLDDGLIREPVSIPLLKAKAKVLMKANDASSACTIYQKVVEIEPTSQHYGLLGYAYMVDRQYNSSITAFQASLRDAADRQKILSLVSEVYKRSGNPMQALFTIGLAIATPGEIAIDTLRAEQRALIELVNQRRGVGQNRLESNRRVS